MYKQIGTTPEIKVNKNSTAIPIATLADEWGGVCQIINDDHCYVLCLKQEDGYYKYAAHIFKEAFQVLKNLPDPD